MSEVLVHPRARERHPELAESDVLAAWQGAVASARRDDGAWVSVGIDNQGRVVECVAIHDTRGWWLIYHAMTPPSKKTLYELGLRRR